MDGQEQGRGVGSVRVWESVVAGCFVAFGALVMWDSRRLGASWGSDGPEAGYFPFYIGLFIVVSAGINLIRGLATGAAGREPFVEWHQLRMVLIVLVPSAFYVGLVANPVYSLGIYEASALFIAAFMRVLGKYSWVKIAAVSIGTMVAFFVMFEIWFQVPLPKGPIEAAFGYS